MIIASHINPGTLHRRHVYKKTKFAQFLDRRRTNLPEMDGGRSRRIEE